VVLIDDKCCWLLIAGCWLLVTGCWLVSTNWWLVIVKVKFNLATPYHYSPGNKTPFRGKGVKKQGVQQSHNPITGTWQQGTSYPDKADVQNI